MNASEKFNDTLICFTGYSEILDNKERKNTLMLIAKKVLHFMFMPFKKNIKSKYWKKFSQAFGTAIPCPSVMFNKETLDDFKFSEKYKVSLDWDAWLRMSEMKGRFVYVSKILLKHRIHTDSATTEGIKANVRQQEDFEIYCRSGQNLLQGSFQSFMQAVINPMKYESDRMKRKVINILKYIILLGVAVALLLYAFKGMDIKKIVQQIFHANMFWVSVSGLISVIAFVVRAYRWNLLIEPMGYSPSLKNTTYSLMVGYFANLAIPRLGEVSRCGALSKAESIPFNKLLGTVIVERVIDVISLLLCMLFAAVIELKDSAISSAKIFLTPLLKSLNNSQILL